MTISYLIFKNGDNLHEPNTVQLKNNNLYELRISSMHDVLTHTSPCIYLTYFLSIEMKVQYRLPSTRICVVKYLCYNRLHGICFKYNYVYRNTNHINNDFYTQENKYSKKVSFPKYSSTGCYSFSKKKSLASPI